VPDLIAALTAAGVRLTRVEPHLPTLEDLYFAVRGRREIADDGGRQLTPVAAMAKPPEQPAPALHAVPATEGSR